MATTTDQLEQSAPQRLGFEFHGSGGEYFKIWIVNILLTLLTLGIFSAWAKVRRMRYFYGNLSLGDQTFTYLADPVAILKGRIIAFSVFVLFWAGWNFLPATAMGLLVIGTLLIPAILVASWRFRMRYSAYRNIRFNFPCRFSTAYRAFLSPLVIILAITGILYGGLHLLDPATLTEIMTSNAGGEVPDDFRATPEDFLLSLVYLVALPFVPFLDCLRVRLLVNHSYYGNLAASARIGGGSFYRVYLVGFLLMGAITTLAMIIIFGAGFVAGMLVGEAGEALLPLGIFIAVLLIYGCAIYSGGYFRAERTNLIYDNIHFGEARVRSHLEFHPVGKIYATNTLAIGLSLGLLIPWAQVRMARYVASVSALEAQSLDNILSADAQNENALGEGMIDAFDLDLGL